MPDVRLLLEIRARRVGQQSLYHHSDAASAAQHASAAIAEAASPSAAETTTTAATTTRSGMRARARAHRRDRKLFNIAIGA